MAKLDTLPLDQAVKIKCRYCDVKETCPLRSRKEGYEASGWTTRCTITPNRPGKKGKAQGRK